MFNRSVSRVLNSGYSAIAGEQSEIARRASLEGSSPIIQRAVVMDVIVKPDELSEDYKNVLRNLVNNSELIEVMPVNAVIARLISSGQGLINSQDTILFPFFSSHIMLPVQVGEVVYVIYEDYQNLGNKLGYWLTRQHGQRTVEDVNYTHIDRMFDQRNNLGYWSTNDKKDIQSLPAPDFPNGGPSAGTQTLSPIENKNPYDVFYNASRATRLTTPEPVPRWNKRPQELILQGSNNTLIMLGEDRVGHVSGSIDSTVNRNNRTDKKGFAGTVDIVVGRGRKIQTTPNTFTNNPTTAQTAPASTSPGNPIDTAPRVIQNVRGSFETDKAPFRQKADGGGRKKDNTKEGDPDFLNDAARLYVTMNSEVDNNFKLTRETRDGSFTYPNNTRTIEQPGETNVDTLSGSFNRSYVVGKGDHIRLIAREDNTLGGVKGSILLLKEGSRDETETIKFGPDEGTELEQSKDLAYIYITPNGEIQISGKKVYLCPGATDEKEPFVLWSKYKDTVDNLQDQIATVAANNSSAVKGLADAVGQVFSLLSTTFASSNICPVNAPNPALTAGSAILNSVWNATVGAAPGSAQLTAAIDTGMTELQQKQTDNGTSNLDPAKHSKIIFGG